MSTETPFSIVIANDLKTGRSVFLTREAQWSEQVAEAELLETESVATTRLQQALDDQRANLVIDPYLVSVGKDRRVDVIRERIRTTGPTILDGLYLTEVA